MRAVRDTPGGRGIRVRRAVRDDAARHEKAGGVLEREPPGLRHAGHIRA